MNPRNLILAALVLFVGSASAQEETTSESVNMEVGMPGVPGPMNMNMNVNVKTKTTTRTTTTRTRTSDFDEPQAIAVPPSRNSDCGAGEDVGCTMQRRGHYPMDFDSFRSLLDALNSNASVINRADIMKTALADAYLTAKQLGLILDLFDSIIYRFDVAKLAAPHVVNPKHALGLASKFESSIYATDFTKLMASQK